MKKNGRVKRCAALAVPHRRLNQKSSCHTGFYWTMVAPYMPSSPAPPLSLINKEGIEEEH
jgi:hypothetical protein